MGNAIRARRSASLGREACGALGAAAASGTASSAQAAQNSGDQAPQRAPLPNPVHERETEYLFGLAEGAGIGAEGERSIEFETTAAFQMRGGRCGALEQEIECEGAPSRLLGYEFTGRTVLAAAFSSQVAGRAAGESHALDLTNSPPISRQSETRVRILTRRGQPRRNGAAMSLSSRISGIGLAGAIALGLLATTASAQESALVRVTLKNHRFSPAEPTAPTGKPITVEVTNLNSTPAEFESKTLRVEKVVAGGGKITIKVRALKPGRYRFFDDYHEDTTEGFLVVN